MEAKNRAIAVRKRSDWIRHISREQATSIAMAGVDRERFSEAVVEAFRANPLLYSVDEVSFCNAIRKCCQDGLIPDAIESAIVPVKNGKVMYMPMKVGLQRMIYRDLRAKIKSGVIYENDKVTLEKRSDGPDVFEVISDPFGNKGALVGAWCYVEIPGNDGEVVLMDKDEIEKVRASSRTTYEDRPWNKWYAQMAEKSVIKRAMNRQRYLIPRDSRSEAALADGIDEENVVAAEPVIVDELVVEEEDEASKPAPQPQAKPVKKEEPPKKAKKAEPKEKPVKKEAAESKPEPEKENPFEEEFNL